MDSVLVRLKRALRALRHLGLRNYLEYLKAPKGEIVPVWIGDTEIWVRRGTPDLSVALSSLGGEFDVLRHVEAQDFDGVIVDAGGYIGTAAIALARMFPRARIITIEPARENMLVLRQNVARFGNIRPVHGALVGQPGPDVEIHDRGTGAWGFSAAAPNGTDTTLLNTAPALDLTQLGVDVREIGILKLDIEGSEYGVLTQATAQLEQINAILIELHDRIVSGCSDAFFAFSENRTVIRDGGEKYLSLRV